MVDLRRALFKGGATDERTSSRGSNASGSQYHHVHEANAAAINDDEHKNEGGAAVEDESPLGQQFGWFSVICLNLSMMIGTGVFSTPGSLLKSLGSVGLVLIYWVIGFLISVAGLAYYLELGSYFPKRAGAEVVYLEQAYKRPKYLLAGTFAATTVILSFSSSNCIVFATYVFSAAGIKGTEWQQKGLACAAYTFAIACILVSTKWSLRLSNVLAMVKIVLLVFIAITGLVVLGGKTRVQNPTANFHNAFAGTTSNGNAVSTALTKIIFSYAGYANSSNIINEVRGGTKTLKWASPAALFLVFILYFFANIAYFAAVPLDKIRNGGTLVAAIFFEEVFGEVAGKRVLPILVASSAMGNLLSVAIGQARVIREVARQGVLPWGPFWTSTRPFNSPGGPLLLKWALTVLVIIALPSGDAFTFVVDLASYPSQAFAALNVIGVWIIRRQRKAAGAGKAEFKAWDIALWFSLAVSIFLLVVPWVPPAGGINGGDVSFAYFTYCFAGLGIMALSWLYWYIWFRVLPKAKKFEWIEVISVAEDGAVSKVLTRHYYANTPPNSPSAGSQVTELAVQKDEELDKEQTLDKEYAKDLSRIQ